VKVTWPNGAEAKMSSGELGGALAVLSPSGMLAELASSYNDLATSLTATMNAQHAAGVTASGAPGGEFFTIAAGGPAATGLSVALTSLADIAVARPGFGEKDGGNADALSQIGQAPDGPGALWAKVVARVAGAVASDTGRANRAEIATVASVSAQASVAGVDNDEETVSLLAFQTAYQASARVLTAVDEALDVLINRTGLVGR